MKRAFGVPLVGLALTAALAACGGSTHPAAGGSAGPTSAGFPPAGATSSSPASVHSCSAQVLPTGFRLDRRHSGSLSPATYSMSADVQAAMEYDAYRSGSRAVYTREAGSGRAPRQVVSCIAMQFASPQQAARFFSSYRYLRQQAGRLVSALPAPRISSLAATAAYLERDQSFRGYGISSTDVLELAGQQGATLYIASVAGSSPSSELARTLLSGLAVQA